MPKDIIIGLEEYGIYVDSYDPYLKGEEVKKTFGVENINLKNAKNYDGIVLCTGHDKFKNLTAKKLKKICSKNPIIYDVRNFYNKEKFKKEGFLYKSL